MGLTILSILGAIGISILAWKRGNIMGGWGGPSFVDGFVRVAFSFLVGMLVYRKQWIIPNKWGLPALSAFLLVAFLFPFHNDWNKISEPLMVIFYFPVLVALGAGTTLSTRQKKINQFSGDLSYPLYMVHYPFLWIFLTYVTVKKPAFTDWIKVVPISVILLILFAYLIFRYVDRPIRSYLKGRLH